MPADLRKAIRKNPTASTRWNGLTPIARRDFVSWVDRAKQAETRQRRIDRTCDMLIEGKRRPCCFSIVPLDLHKALAAARPAKAQWSDLTPDERRDLIAWIDGAQKVERNARIQQTCALLAAGKRRPQLAVANATARKECACPPNY